MQKFRFIFILLFVFTVVTLGANIARKNRNAVQNTDITANNVKDNNSSTLKAHIFSLYTEANLASYNLDSNVFFKAMVGYYNLKGDGKLSETKNIISVVDFSKPSTEKRLWVVDLNTHKVLFYSLVAHGKNSGENVANKFSNVPESNMSSLGFYVTDKTYTGKHGLSLTINGMDKGFNANARQRAVVVHGASYVSQSFINLVGRLGRSQGCPAIPEDIAPEVIETIADGTVFFMYYPDKTYEASSRYLNLAHARNVYNSETQVTYANLVK